MHSKKITVHSQKNSQKILYYMHPYHKHNVNGVNGLPRTHLSGGDCSTSVVDPNVNSYTQTKPPLVPTHRVGKERSAKHNK